MLSRFARARANLGRSCNNGNLRKQTREPSFLTLFAYGRVAQIHVEILIHDEASLPDRLLGDFDFARYKQELGVPRREAET
jgi:hypothetical protein